MTPVTPFLTGIAEIVRTASKLISYGTTNSLVEQGQMTRIEPLVAISEDCLALPYLGDILQTATSIVAMYYLQAASTLGTIGAIKVTKMLDELSPNRNAGSILLSMERYPASVDNLSNSYTLFPTRHHNNKSAEGHQVWEYDKVLRRYTAKPDADAPSAVAGTKKIDVFFEPANLAVGKVIEVEFSSGQDRRKIPITVRLDTSVVPTKVMRHIVEEGGVDIGFFEGLHDVASGKREFWNDFIACSDIIKRRKEILLDDTSGVYAQILQRVTGNKAYGILSGRPSLNTASAIFVVTKTQLEAALAPSGRNIKDKTTRKSFFDTVAAMLLIELDTDYEYVNLYYRGMDNVVSIAVRDIKASAKKGGPDIQDLLKQYTVGTAPAF